MSYTINLFNGTVLATVADGTIDTTATNIKLVGKNYTGYGEILNENYVWMLENFASDTQPTTPLVGQLWWNTDIGTLTVYDGTQFKAVSSSTVDVAEPTGAVEGDLWWDSGNEQLYVYNGATWVLIGPAFAAGIGQSGAIVETIQDTGLTDHIIVSTFVADTIVTITSKDATFTPNVAITDFGDIKPGVNMTDPSGAIAGARFWGKAADSTALAGLIETQFLRRDIADNTIGKITFATNLGISIGAAAATGQLTISTGAFNSVDLLNTGTSGNLLLKATNSVAAPITMFDFDPDALVISGSNNKLIDLLDPTAAQHAATKAYVDGVTGITAGTEAVLADGSVSMSGILLPDTDGTVDMGSVAFTFQNIYATTFQGESTTALYADMAERFEADATLEPGTVVALGGDKEITAAMTEGSNDVFGVISTKPAHLMNAGAGSDETHPPVAMAGRVPVRVTGQVRKGDRLISAGNGLARAGSKEELTAWNVIGRALEDKYSEGIGGIEAIVSMKS